MAISAAEIGALKAQLEESYRWARSQSTERAAAATLGEMRQALRQIPRPEPSQLVHQLEGLVHDLLGEAYQGLKERLGRLVAKVHLSDHSVEVERRVLSAHHLLEGGMGIGDFGDLRLDSRGDILVGLGVRLRGGVGQYLVRWAESKSDPVRALLRCFGEEGEGLFAAIEQGAEAVEAFLSEALIFHRDPILRKTHVQLPEAWRRGFVRLARDLDARRIQLDLVAGERLGAARKLAEQAGLESLRGLALAYELQPLAAEFEGVAFGALGGLEHERMVGLAERLMGRAGAPLSSHLEKRVRSLVDGFGEGELGAYMESRVLGQDADQVPWRWHQGVSLDADVQVAAVPIPGRLYLIQRGDRLSTIARRAYGMQGDYRVLLRHNPHISPQELTLGARIFIPMLKDDRDHDAGVKVQVIHEALVVNEQLFGPLPGRSFEILEEMASQIQAGGWPALRRARALRLGNGWRLLLDQELLLELDDRDLEVVEERFGELAKGMAKWAAHLASVLRGELVLEPGHALVLGRRGAEPNRHHWVRWSLRRAHEANELSSMSLRRRPEGIEVVSDAGVVLVVLGDDDLELMLHSPERRLSDSPMRPSPEALARLWVSDLLGQGHELLVSPLRGQRQLRWEAWHGGRLILAPVGTQVFPTAKGRVAYVGPAGASGQSVLLEHEGQLVSRYFHLSAISVRPGQQVAANESIGRVGLSGRVPEPGLGFVLERSAGASFGIWRRQGGSLLEIDEHLGAFTHEQQWVRWHE